MDNAEILISDHENLVAQAELLLNGCIEFDDYGFHLTPRGYETAWSFLKNLPLAQRSLVCLFFEDTGEFE
ncbi:MAG: hypothetical protein PHE50_00865 [Dehalococcoidales bacterium]|nr:hypothetical protein [Dehalococcoidales bacterium]